MLTSILFEEQSELRIDVAAVLQQAIDDGWGSLGFNLRMDASPIDINGPFVAFWSSDANVHPRILLNDSIPEPATAALLLLPASALLASRHRQRCGSRCGKECPSV